MKKYFIVAVLLLAGCQTSDPVCPPQTIEVPTPPICESEKAALAELAKVKDELAVSQAEVARLKAPKVKAKPAPKKK